MLYRQGNAVTSPDPARASNGTRVDHLLVADMVAPGSRVLDVGCGDGELLRLLEQRQTGMATLLISEDLDEIRALSDRIAIIYEGKIVGVVENETTSLEQIGLMMAGAH